MADEPEPRTHDFGPGRRCWGHDYTISSVRDGGKEIQVSGWGCDGASICQGDYLLLEAPGGQRAPGTR
jgi:hypothetical protein